MSSQSDKPSKRRVHHFDQAKTTGQKIAVVTAYDYPTAVAVDTAGVDAILVGDSLGMVALGLDSTIPVTLDMMVHHTAAVRRGANRAFIIADMPFLTYGVSRDESLKNAGRLIQEAGAEAVKIEGGVTMALMVFRYWLTLVFCPSRSISSGGTGYKAEKQRPLTSFCVMPIRCRRRGHSVSCLKRFLPNWLHE